MAATSFAVPACSSDVTTNGGGGDDGSNTGSNTGSNSGSSSGSGDQWDNILANRVTDYPAALRIAALRLTGNLPTVAEINEVSSATGDAQKTAYTTRITEYMTRPAFANQMFLFWRDTFKTGGATAAFDPVADTAAAFAADLAVNNKSYMDLLTRASNNCPTFNPTTGAFTAAECVNGGPKAGVLTNPGLQKAFFSNVSMRRGRFVQETFDCLRFPVEISTTPTDVGGSAPYIGVWPFASIASPQNGGGRINFQDVSAAICANCHQTLNHLVPLFAYYDTNGAYQTTIQVPVPIPGNPIATLADWLPPGDSTAWRYGKPAADIPALGTQMAADDGVTQCGVARYWNFALGKEDIVDQLVSVPPDTIKAQVDAFKQNGFLVRDLLMSIFTSDAFVKF
ncbi:MAG TPA: hypothetical protein VHW23_29750 [Kofleriaceae bacterium]|nr:hypothetical protein [Kofleriaceae bacterium]